jgi:hypothetical protein
MKMFAVFGAALLAATVAIADEPSCGLQPGDSVGAFTVEKVAGNPNDDVPIGKSLCYRCKLGARPVVMVFARKADDNLAALVKELDAEVPEHSDKKLASFVNIIGSDNADDLKSAAEKFGKQHNPQHVAIVVPEDTQNGPKEFGICPTAETTVVIYRGGKVAASHAFAAGKLDSAAIDKVIADTDEILN